MPTTERLVTLEDTCPPTGISAVRRTGAQTSAHLEIALSVDTRATSHRHIARTGAAGSQDR
jgi:hypothetical protein